MSQFRVIAAGMGAIVVGAGVYAAPPAKSPAPVASYWMDVATQSGMAAGMMNGQAAHALELRLASKQKPAGAAQADHLIPAGLQMGASLPLLTPVREEAAPAKWQQPKGRMLFYWGCGEHVGAGQPTIIDFAKMQPGKMPPGMAAMTSMAHVRSGPTSAPGFGRWPNERDGRPVPASGSLLGAHKVQANYAPPIAFSLGAGQDFMPALALREAGALPSGASRLAWQPVAQATGYAVSMFGSAGNGDVIMWSSAKSAQMPAMDFIAPGEVKRLVAAGSVLPPSADQCVLPAEVAAASPQGMVMLIGYGPEVDFSDKPKLPTWTTKVRYKTTASLVRGMAAMMGGQADANQAQQPSQQQPKKRRGIGIGDLLGAVPH